MSDNLTVFDVDYTGVAGIKCKGTGNGTLTYIRPQGSKSITQNGTSIDVAQYASVDVSVSGGGSPTLQAKTRTISAAGTFVDTPDSGYDGLSSVTTTVPSADASAATITSQYTTESGQRKWVFQYEAYAEEGGWVDEGLFGKRQEYKYNAVPANTTVTPTGSSQTIGGANYMLEGPVTVAAVPAGTAGTPTATKTIDHAETAALIVPSVTNSAGYISGGTITGTQFYVTVEELVAGNTSVADSPGVWNVADLETLTIPAGSAIASASKGSVSNHSVSVTPTVTRTAGWVGAGTANGTAVTVSASELVSGSETKTANGTYNVTNLASLVVAVPIVTYYTSSSAPTSSQGSNGDIWLVTA